MTIMCTFINCRWRRGFSWTHTVHHSVRIMREMLDRMVEGQFLWIVYDMNSPEVARILDGNKINLCRSACALINFHIVEMHRPERCLRQFGMRQGIPPPATNFDKFHKLTRQGRNNCDWATYHKDFVDMWNDRYNFVIDGDYVIPGTPSITMDYIGWYYHISQISLSPTVIPSNIIGYHPVDANYRQFITRPAHVQTPRTQNEFEPGPSTSNITYTPPHVVPSFPSYDYGYHTPIAGSFTQFLQSDFRPFMNESRPILNTSPLTFQEYSDTERYEVGGNIADTSTSAAQTRTHGDAEEMLGRGRRVIRRSLCGTERHLYHQH
ncbi:uncharacterized protein [Primulina eburnea]|uniref:uncharacterized protein n=1 Tax=Primulina eburnea TaxID=1245227 RepID=UPI003C6C029A